MADIVSGSATENHNSELIGLYEESTSRKNKMNIIILALQGCVFWESEGG